MKDPAWIEGDDIARGLVPDPPDNYIDPDEKKALLALKEAVDIDTLAETRLDADTEYTERVAELRKRAVEAVEELDMALDTALDETVSELDYDGTWY